MFKLISIVIFHHLVIWCVVLGAMSSLFLLPISVALVVCILSGRLATSREECVITNMENRQRVKLGMPKIKGFIGHYYTKVRFKKLKVIDDYYNNFHGY